MLSGNRMGANVGKNMAQSLVENTSLKKADFSDNTFGVTTAEGGESSDLGLVLGHGLCRYSEV